MRWIGHCVLIAPHIVEMGEHCVSTANGEHVVGAAGQDVRKIGHMVLTIWHIVTAPRPSGQTVIASTGAHRVARAGHLVGMSGQIVVLMAQMVGCPAVM